MLHFRIIYQISIGRSIQEWLYEFGVTFRVNTITKCVGVRNMQSKVHASLEARLATDIGKFHHIYTGHWSKNVKVPSGLKELSSYW